MNQGHAWLLPNKCCPLYLLAIGLFLVPPAAFSAQGAVSGPNIPLGRLLYHQAVQGYMGLLAVY